MGKNEERTHCFEDLLSLVGTTGCKNFLIFFACCIGSMFTSIHTFAYQFLGGTPDHWCRIDQLTATGWTDENIKAFAIPYTINTEGHRDYSKCEMYDLNYQKLANLSYEEVIQNNTDYLRSNNSISCSSRTFVEGPETITTKWDLVCGRRALFSTTQAAIQGGMLFGSVIFGYLIDRFGRLIIYKFCVVTYLIGAFGTALSPSITIFILLKVLTAMLGNGIYLSGFVLSMEFCAAEQRSYISNYYVLPWAFGMMLTPAIAYVVPTWYWMEVAFTAPALILFANFWILPESPRWLIMNELYEDALSVLTTIAQSNGQDLPSRHDLFQLMEAIHKNEQLAEQENLSCTKKIKTVFTDLFVLLINEQYRMRTLCVFYCLFSVSLVYYGVSLGSVTLSTNDYLYMFLGGVIEIPSYILLWPAVVALGRKKTYVLLYLISGASIFSVMLITIHCNLCLSVLKVVLYLCGKFAITAAFHLAWVFTAEMYPTKYRSLVIGEATGVGRVGSICSPYINDVLGMVSSWAPAALFGLFSVTAALTALTFPETGGKNLPCLVQNPSKKEKSLTVFGRNNPSFENVEHSNSIL